MNRMLLTLVLCSCASAQRPQPAAQTSPPAAPAPQQPAGTPDGALGLSKGSVADVPEPLHWAYVKDSPGGNDALPRTYPQAPPQVPHDVNGYLPITFSRNRCLQCHAAEKKTAEDPTPIPKSHYVDLRNAPGAERSGKRSPARDSSAPRATCRSPRWPRPWATGSDLAHCPE